MSKIGLTVVKSEAESPLSPHFGMAGWVLIYDTETQQKIFERNRLLYGRGVVEILQRHRCTDAIFSSIGRGALEGLEAGGIRGWYAPEGVPVPELVKQLQEGKLTRAEEASSTGREHHGGARARHKSTNCDDERKGNPAGPRDDCERPRRRRCCARHAD
jgi:predicted Fe-Mo cluster-binding NifX family protein